MQTYRCRCLVLVHLTVLAVTSPNAFGESTTASLNPPPVKMGNSNPVLEMIVDGAPARLILTTDLDGIVVCEDASTSRRDWLMTDSEFDNARKRLRYELHWVVPDVRELEVQVPALGYSGHIEVGFFQLGDQEMRMAAVAYYLGSLDADGFIGAGFAFQPDQSPLWETIQEAASDAYGYTYDGRDHSKKKGEVYVDTNEIKLAERSADVEAFDSDNYVWSEPFVSLSDGSDGASNAQGISFPIHEAIFDCNVSSGTESGDAERVGKMETQSVQLFGDYSSSWDVVVDFNVPCLELPREFYDALAGWIGLRLDSRLGLSEVAAPASALPDLLFSLSFTGVQLVLPLRSLVLPELSGPSSSSNNENSTRICIQRSASMVQRGTAAFAAPTTTAAEVARLQRLHGAIGTAVYNMIDSPIVFGAMVLDALGSVVFDGTTKRTGIRKPTATQWSDAVCLKRVSCTGHQELITHLNLCQDPDCSQYYFHSLDETTKHCVLDPSWTAVLAVTTTLLVVAELFFSLSLRRLAFQSQERASSPRQGTSPRASRH